MADYPAQWESDVVLADGGTVHLRPICADDDAGLVSLYERVSDESVYLRFFSPVPRAAAAHLERLTTIDYRDHMAFVAELADELVAVARYDSTGSGAAEVAFIVRDDQQGRGLGTLMLEHLAAVARANGITAFAADTLPHNRKMLGVLRDAGWETTRAFADGTIREEISIEPTDSSHAAIEGREQHSEAASITRILAPRSVAVVGASRTPGTIGHELFRNLLTYGFTGPVYPVNPSTTSVAGVRCYPTMLEVPDHVDLAIIVVPAPAVFEVVQQCAQQGVRGLVVISAGFAEMKGGQAADERAVVELARRHGMRLVGPNCMGILNTNPDVRLHGTFAPIQPVPGRVGFSSQSGGLGIELIERAGRLGLGISSFVSIGNKADVSSNDLLQYWETDPDTDVILLYLESFGNPRKFARLARRIARTKPIVVVKSGRTGAGRRAASSHTAALATPDDTVDALCRQAGVIRVDTLEELFDTARVLLHQPLPAGRRVAVLGNAGGPGILSADACAGAGLDVPELAPETQAELRTFLHPGAAVNNPVDLVASATAPHYERAIRVVLADPGIDALLVNYVPPLRREHDDVANAIAAAVTAAADLDKPVVVCLLGQDGIAEGLQGHDGNRAVPSFAFPETAARALGRAADLADWRRRPEGVVPSFPDVDVATARALVETRLEHATEAGLWLDTDDIGVLARCFGIPICASQRAVSMDAAVAAATELGFPVALKAGSPKIVHKSDAGGVRLGLADAGAVRDAYTDMEARLGDAMGGAIVQRMVPNGVETIVGVVHDASFGSIVMFGLGGTTAELLGDRAVRILPLTDVDAHHLVRSLRGSPLLFGYRGAPLAAVERVEDILLRVGLMADALPEIAELDLNPVVVSEHAAVALDVKLRLAPVPRAMPSDLRRMRDAGKV
jgi:acetyl coenzyme A synthetase (ADP forming)-like protein